MTATAKVQDREREWLETTAQEVLAKPVGRQLAGAAVGHANTPPRLVRMVKLAEIAEDSPLQSRVGKFDPGGRSEDAELLRSIQAHGVLEPVMLFSKRSMPDAASYQVVFGHRRVSAARLAGLSELPAMIAAADDNVGVLTLAENTGSRALTPYEKAVGLIRLREASPGMTQQGLANLAGISQPMVSNLLQALTGSPPPLLELFSEGMDALAILDLQPIFAKMTSAKQVSFARRIRGLSRRSIQDIVRQLELGASQETAVRATLRKRKKGRSRSEAPKRESQATLNAAVGELLPDEAAQRALADYTGADPREARVLFSNPKARGAGRDALTLACAAIARGGSDEDILGLSMSLASDRRLAEIALNHLRLQRTARAQMARMREGRKARLFARIMFKAPRDAQGTR
jgi:ParB/RepB/Spo0J family partition protein